MSTATRPAPLHRRGYRRLVFGSRSVLIEHRVVRVALIALVSLAALGLVGLLIAPGAIAFLMVRRFGAMLAVAVLACLTGMLSGVWLSFWLDASPAATIVLVLTAMFLFAFLRRSLQVRVLSRKEGGPGTAAPR